MTRTLTVDPVALPADLHSDDAADFLAMATVFTDATRHDLGGLDHLSWVASEMLPTWQDQTYVVRRGFLARRGTEVVGALQLSAPLEAGARSVEADLLAAPSARGQGVEEALLERLLAEVRALGRTTVQSYTIHRADAPGDRLVPPTGFGGIPLDDQTRFFLDAGFTLQQVERNSVFELTAGLDHVRRMCDEAIAAAGPDYRLFVWSGPTPTEHRAGYAYILSRMSTDVPLSGLDMPEEHWDIERVERRDARLAAGGLLIGVAAIEHVPSGRLVAYNELTIGEDRERPTHQWGTLVVKEHRGRRLGTIVKCANLLRWRELVPTSPFVTTFNAEENRHMLDVNEAIGFRPLTVAGAWQRALS